MKGGIGEMSIAGILQHLKSDDTLYGWQDPGATVDDSGRQHEHVRQEEPIRLRLRGGKRRIFWIFIYNLQFFFYLMITLIQSIITFAIMYFICGNNNIHCL